MNESRIAEFRNEANTCTAKAEAATDATAKLFYTGLANGWLALIARLEHDTVSGW
jgi:hypothetical protein